MLRSRVEGQVSRMPDRPPPPPADLPDDDHKYEENLCLCQSMRPAIITCRLFGFFPVVTEHIEGECVFKRSWGWLVYSVVLCLIFYYQYERSKVFLEMNKDKSFPELMAALNDSIYMFFVWIITSINLYRHPRFVCTLNKVMPVARENGLLCTSALKTLKWLQCGYVGMIVLSVVMEFATIFWLESNENYYTNYDYNIFITRGLHVVPFMFYLLFMTISSLFVSNLGCYERLLINTLKYNPVHPLDEISEINTHRSILGLIKYNVCSEAHVAHAGTDGLPMEDLIEYLRAIHEDISGGMYNLNDCVNPQLLVHMVLELSVLIIHWYEVVIYTAYTFTSPFVGAINILNWVFVVTHSIGLFIYLKNAQKMKNMVYGLSNFLLEYSTRVSTVPEHQQVRVFMEKVVMHRPITANGVFCLDLGIAGPISANILTYVLVALQFDIPRG